MSDEHPFTEAEGERYLERVIALHALARSDGSHPDLRWVIQHDVCMFDLAMAQWRNDCYPMGARRLSPVIREHFVVGPWFAPIAPKVEPTRGTVLCRRVGPLKPRIELHAAHAIELLEGERFSAIGIALHRLRSATEWVKTLHLCGRAYADQFLLVNGIR